MVRDIEKTFQTLRKINMKLNIKKCSFGLAEGVFLGYVITPEGIKPCLDKTTAVLQLPSPRTIKEVQSLNGKLASLNRFLSKSAKKSLSLFQTLKKCIKKSDFRWTTKAEQAFQQLKQHLSALSLLAAPKPQEELIMYLSATHGAISAVLLTKWGTAQTPVYFISRVLQGPKLNYSPMEKLVLSLVFAAKRLRRYFQAHPIAVITDQPIKQVMSHFLNEIPSNASQGASVAETQEEPWTLFTDGSSCVDGSGSGLILTNPDGVEFTYALRFQFAASNNEAEYEALIAGLWIATQIGVKTYKQMFTLNWKRSDSGNRGGMSNMDDGISKLLERRPLSRRAEESQVPDRRNGLLHEMDRSKSGGNDYRRTSEEIRMGQYCMPLRYSRRNNLRQRSLGEGIKERLGEGNKNWVEELPHSYLQRLECPDEELRLNLDLLEERQELAAINEARSKSKMTKYYNSRVRGMAFQPGDFIYRSNDASHAAAGGKLGPYEVTDALGNGAYKLRSMDGMMLPKTWNVANLKRCYL
nr:reverse transcriptase domain-containing protein [Tanacetum cinerariifolium]